MINIYDLIEDPEWKEKYLTLIKEYGEFAKDKKSILNPLTDS